MTARLRIKDLVLASLLPGTLVAFAPAAAQDSGEDSPALRAAIGKATYRVYCSNCHGETARGDGPVAEVLKVPPADLTRISENNRGVFPSADVYATIDGRTEVDAHGSREMPVWGLTFQDRNRDSEQEGAVQEKIRDLVFYLESIQVEAGAD